MPRKHANKIVFGARPVRALARYLEVSGRAPNFKSIPLTQGQRALVDDEDFAHFGNLKWCAWWNKATKSFYAVRHKPRTEKGLLYLHREILGIFDPRVKVDHRNHDTLDNRRHNLRACTHAQNSANKKGPNANNTSGVRGVSWNKRAGKWNAKIGDSGERIHLGYFTNKSEAAAAYALANKARFGEYGGGL